MDLRTMWRRRRLFVLHLLLLLEMCGGRTGKVAVMARRHRNKGNQWWLVCVCVWWWWIQTFNGDFRVQSYICGQIFMKVRLVLPEIWAELCFISQCWKIFFSILDSDLDEDKCWNLISSALSLVYRYICGKMFTKIRCLYSWQFYRQTDRQTDRHTNAGHYVTSLGDINTLYLKKTCCRIFAITSSTVYQFWKFFHCWIQRWTIYKINNVPECKFHQFSDFSWLFLHHFIIINCNHKTKQNCKILYKYYNFVDV